MADANSVRHWPPSSNKQVRFLKKKTEDYTPALNNICDGQGRVRHGNYQENDHKIIIIIGIIC